MLAARSRDGVAETKIVRGARRSHSSNFSGRLSSADGRRKPNSTSVSLRERSPLYIAPSCGIGHVRFVDHQQRVGRQVVEQRRRRLARRAPGQVPRVVLDAAGSSRLSAIISMSNCVRCCRRCASTSLFCLV